MHKSRDQNTFHQNSVKHQNTFHLCKRSHTSPMCYMRYKKTPRISKLEHIHTYILLARDEIHATH